VLWFVQQSLVLLVLAYLVGLVSGWLLFRDRARTPRTEATDALGAPDTVADEAWDEDAWFDEAYAEITEHTGGEPARVHPAEPSVEVFADDDPFPPLRQESERRPAKQRVPGRVGRRGQTEPANDRDVAPPTIELPVEPLVEPPVEPLVEPPVGLPVTTGAAQAVGGPPGERVAPLVVERTEPAVIDPVTGEFAQVVPIEKAPAGLTAVDLHLVDAVADVDAAAAGTAANGVARSAARLEAVEHVAGSESAESVEPDPPEPPAVTPTVATAAAAVATRATPSTRDDLTRIDGVTTEMAEALRVAGLRSYRRVSWASIDELRSALRDSGLQPTFKVAYWPLAASDLADQAAADAVAEPDPDDAAAAAPAVVDVSTEPDGPPAVVDVTTEPDGPPAVVVLTPSTMSSFLPKADDLERIEGIGVKIAGALRDIGIVTYADLAAAPHGWLRSALSAAGLRMAPTLPTWGDQARLLAAGDEDGFAALRTKVSGGRETGARL